MVQNDVIFFAHLEANNAVVLRGHKQQVFCAMQADEVDHLDKTNSRQFTTKYGVEWDNTSEWLKQFGSIGLNRTDMIKVRVRAKVARDFKNTLPFGFIF